MICEELSGGWWLVHSGERLGPLSRYGLLRVKWTISEKEAGVVASGKEAWSTFEVEFIKGEVDHQ